MQGELLIFLLFLIYKRKKLKIYLLWYGIDLIALDATNLQLMQSFPVSRTRVLYEIFS